MSAPSTLGIRELTVAGATAATMTRDGGFQCRVHRDALEDFAAELSRRGLEVQLLCGSDTRRRSRDFTLTYVFAPPPGRPRVTAFVTIPEAEPRFPSLAVTSFAASRFEREIRDLLGLVPTGHPDARRLALHQFWPEGYYPLRHDVEPRQDFADAGQPFPFRRVGGDGLFEITVGPVHAGIIEPGHFRFTVEGETIVNLETRLGFVHKGTERLFTTLPFDRTAALAECVSGDETVAHAVAYCQAIETMAGVELPPRAAWLRVVLLELERLYNHVGDVGMIVNDTGFAFGHAHCFRVREELLRLNEGLTGSRLLRGAVVPGGIADTIRLDALAALPMALGRLLADFIEIAEISLANSLVLERLQGTGRLTTATARDIQVVGLVARASGIDADLRRDAPFAAYDKLDVRVASAEAGDVWARTMIRIEEAREAARLVAEVVEQLAGDASRVPLSEFRGGDHAVSAVESWRGPVWYWVSADGPAQLARVKIADPSFRNWPALEYAVLKNIVPDFPLCNKSFNLSYSGSDL